MAGGSCCEFGQSLEEMDPWRPSSELDIFWDSGNRENMNQMNIQPFAAYFLPDGWSIGYSGNILVNWEADSGGDVWNVSIGLSVSKF